MKVQIGSQYTGPALDRPCLRQLPRDWVISTDDPPRMNWSTLGDVAVFAACVFFGVLAVGQIIRQVL